MPNPDVAPELYARILAPPPVDNEAESHEIATRAKLDTQLDDLLAYAENGSRNGELELWKYDEEVVPCRLFTPWFGWQTLPSKGWRFSAEDFRLMVKLPNTTTPQPLMRVDRRVIHTNRLTGVVAEEVSQGFEILWSQNTHGRGIHKSVHALGDSWGNMTKWRKVEETDDDQTDWRAITYVIDQAHKALLAPTALSYDDAVMFTKSFLKRHNNNVHPDICGIGVSQADDGYAIAVRLESEEHKVAILEQYFKGMPVDVQVSGPITPIN